MPPSGISAANASSAAIYGASTEFRDDDASLERPLNVYGFSKLLFDRYVRANAARGDPQVVGLRYFNVYGPGEAHKGSMASVVWHLSRQLAETGELRLFEGSHGYGNGEQRRETARLAQHKIEWPDAAEAGASAARRFRLGDQEILNARVDHHLPVVVDGVIEHVPKTQLVFVE